MDQARYTKLDRVGVMVRSYQGVPLGQGGVSRVALETREPEARSSQRGGLLTSCQSNHHSLFTGGLLELDIRLERSSYRHRESRQ